jgi:hypothetical protein
MVDHASQAEEMAKNGQVKDLVSFLTTLQRGTKEEARQAQQLGPLIETAFNNLVAKRSADR